MYRSGPVRSVCKDRSHRSLKLVLLFFSKILLSLRKPPKPSFPPRSKTLDPILCQKVIIFPTRPDRSSVRSGSQRNIMLFVMMMQTPPLSAFAKPFAICVQFSVSIQLSCLTSLGAPYGKCLFNIFVHTGPPQKSPPAAASRV